MSLDTAIPWEALATFLAGLMAVVGASIVAWRQGKILHAQVENERRQVDLDRSLRETTIKLELLDRRSTVILGLRRLTSSFIANAKLERVEQAELYELITTAELIFPLSHSEQLHSILMDSNRISVKYRASDSARRQGDSEKADKKLDEALDLEQRVFEKLPEILKEMIKHTSVAV